VCGVTDHLGRLPKKRWSSLSCCRVCRRE
jgi:hypothetical protein